MRQTPDSRRIRPLRRSRRTGAVVLLAAALALAGCGASDERADAGAKGASAADAASRPDESAALDGNFEADGKTGTGGSPAQRKPAVPQQHIIRTAELSVEVPDAARALARARTVVRDAGGHVANESTERVDDDHVTSQVVLRVPQAAYESVLKDLAGSGKLLARSADAKDVTDQVVDVESRIATQRASVERVRKLMDQATKLSDVVTLEGQLSSRQADLESLLAQQAALKDRTTLATITLHLTEPEAGTAEGDDRPGFLEALGGGWSALVTVATWAVIVLAAAAPWLAVLLVAYALWRWLIRPRLRGRAEPVAVAAPTADAADPADPEPSTPSTPSTETAESTKAAETAETAERD
ncbi:DUF4349 domain-containing protein [Streptomyces sp. NPDC047928]|uniref:DUF4349 domain-containing protein n=1 Tax=unclassified Streptomyces TaxID=2593676 RepID=UPI003710B188